MKHLFVPYETAVMAKEKGFDEKCLAHYVGKKLNIGLESSANYLASFTKSEICAASLYQQLVDWLREKHQLHLEIIFHDSLQRYGCYIMINIKPTMKPTTKH